MAHDRRPILTLWADKIEVRKYVEQKIGSQYLIPAVGTFSSAVDVLLSNLPDQCVIKPNHGSGAVIILSDRSNNKNLLPKSSSLNVWGRYEVSKASVDQLHLQSILQSWLSTSYFNDCGHFPEYAYKDISPRILVEELLVLDQEIAADYRFFIFNGRCEYIEVDQSWNSSPTRDMFDRDWQAVEVQLKYPRATMTPNKPETLNKMIELAETLADGIDHIRVDFYLLGDRIYFGEMTNYHTSGKQIFKPTEFNLEFGKNWHPQDLY